MYSRRAMYETLPGVFTLSRLLALSTLNPLWAAYGPSQTMDPYGPPKDPYGPPMDPFIGHLSQTGSGPPIMVSHTNIKDWVHDRFSHKNIKEGVHDRLSHTNIKDGVQ